MNTKQPIVNKTIQAEYYSADSVLQELKEMQDLAIRKSIIEAELCDFATETEVKAVFDKWKLVPNHMRLKNENKYSRFG